MKFPGDNRLREFDDIVRQSVSFWAAFWAGLAAPVALYVAPAPYPVHEGIGSVARSFANVGLQLSRAASQAADDGKPGRAD